MRRIQAVIDQNTCEPCKRLHGAVVTDAAITMFQLRQRVNCKNIVNGCRCYFVFEEERKMPNPNEDQPKMTEEEVAELQKINLEKKLSPEEIKILEKADEVAAANEAEALKNVDGDGVLEIAIESTEEVGIVDPTEGSINSSSSPSEEQESQLSQPEGKPNISSVLTGDGSGEALSELTVPHLDPLAKGSIILEPKEAFSDPLAEEAKKLAEEGVKLEHIGKKLAVANRAISEAGELLSKLEQEESATVRCGKCGAHKKVFRSTWTGSTRCSKCSAIIENDQPDAD